MNLIVQGQDVQTRDLKDLAKLSGATAIESINQQAFRLRNASHDAKEAVKAHCETARLDFAFVPEGMTLKNFGLLVMDMDSTLISIECIDEIADMEGIKPQVAAITESAMRGEIDFAESLARRVALLEGLDETALQRVYDERLRLNPGAEIMLKKLKSNGIKTMLVSGGFTFFTERLKTRLGLDHVAANTLEVRGGKLTGKILGRILDAQGKADALLAMGQSLHLAPSQIIAMGDGANDLKMMAAAGLSIAYHAKPVVKAQATYSLSHVGLDGVINLFSGT